MRDSVMLSGAKHLGVTATRSTESLLLGEMLPFGQHDNAAQHTLLVERHPAVLRSDPFVLCSLFSVLASC
jgi:hypothetical protein